MGAHFSPATAQELGAELKRLIGSMPPPRGQDVDMLSNGYFDGLKSFPASAIKDAIDGFMDGRFGEKKWLPSPPELATMVRSCLGARTAVPGRAYATSAPKSGIRKEGCTKDWAREQVARGHAPKGSIWFPGTYGDNAAWGDFYDPDPSWGDPKIIPTKDEADEAARLEQEREVASQRRFVSPDHLPEQR